MKIIIRQQHKIEFIYSLVQGRSFGGLWSSHRILLLPLTSLCRPPCYYNRIPEMHEIEKKSKLYSQLNIATVTQILIPAIGLKTVGIGRV